jgi:hypothetical protein
VAADAEAAFLRALREVLEEAIEIAPGVGNQPDFVVSVPGGRAFGIEVKGVATRAEPGPISSALRRTWDEEVAELSRDAGTDVCGVVVAAAVPDATKAILRDHGWGWLDRRGEIHLRAPGLVVHADDIEPSIHDGLVGGRDPIRGRSGITAAAGLLLDPDRPPGVRDLAHRGGLAPSSISTALADLRAAALVEDDGRPLLPELFRELADAWKPVRYALAELPRAGTRLATSMGLDALDQPGWGVGSTVAAAAWSAPVVVASSAPPDFYVPNEGDLRAARQELREAKSLEERACTVAVAPSTLVVQPRYDHGSNAPWLHWPLVHPLFVALDLAQDRARGAEILEDWDPPPPHRRVW